MDDQSTDRERSRLVEKIRRIHRGIIFVHAKWSGGSVWALPRFKEFITNRSIPNEHVLYLDADDEELAAVPEFYGKMHGWGEVAVILGGQIVFLTNLGDIKEQFEQRCAQVMDVYDATK